MENPQIIQFTSECIKGTYNIFETIYHNICTDSTSVVANGFLDFFFFIALGVTVILGFVIILKVLFDW